MSSFETTSFSFYSYDFSSKAHQVFVRSLIRDPNVQRYLKNIESFIYQDTEVPLNNAFLVGCDDDIVGYINLYGKGKIVDMDYAVHPTFRGIRNASNETIGCQILKETSNHIFANYDFIRYIRLMIARSNINSINAATRAGFIPYDAFFSGDEYRKYPRAIK